MVDSGTLNVVLNLITVLIGGGLLGVFLRYRLGIKKLASGDMADIRDHYAKEVSALRQKLSDQEGQFHRMEKHWREMMDASDRRHDECERAREQDRLDRRALHTEIAGLRDQILRYSANAVLVMETEPSDMVKDAAERVRQIVDKRENGDESS